MILSDFFPGTQRDSGAAQSADEQPAIIKPLQGCLNEPHAISSTGNSGEKDVWQALEVISRTKAASLRRRKPGLSCHAQEVLSSVSHKAALLLQGRSVLQSR